MKLSLPGIRRARSPTAASPSTFRPSPPLAPKPPFGPASKPLRAPVLAALADAVSSALLRIRDIDLGNIARFPDCAAWAAAAAPVLGLDAAAITEAVANPDSVWIGSDPLRDTLYALLRPNPAWSRRCNHAVDRTPRSRPARHPTQHSQEDFPKPSPASPASASTTSKGAQGQRTLSIFNATQSAGRKTETLYAPYPSPLPRAF